MSSLFLPLGLHCGRLCEVVRGTLEALVSMQTIVVVVF